MPLEHMTGRVAPVLDKGYVRIPEENGNLLILGSDLSVVNAARASYAKESEEMGDKDKKLLKYLIKHGHTSPFRHAFITLEVYAPLMVARQWWKYVVGSDHTMDGWNEASRRYITIEPEFYVPSVWRSAPENSKQGSGGPVGEELSLEATKRLIANIDKGLEDYNWALENNFAPEQARLFLAAYGMYTVWRWSASLQSVAHFLAQRIPEDAQFEIQEFAKAVKTLVWPNFSVTIDAFTEVMNG
jgi:thymidylate synthase (FAD)